MIISLVGNPNVGKSTLFNALTGGNQHTGNWPGKTVQVAQGRYVYKGREYHIVDLPGCYSLISRSEEEQITVEFLTEHCSDCVLILVDATCLERNLTLALQVLQVAKRAVVCVNLMDEAKRKEINVDLNELEQQLGVPVVGIAASSGEGLDRLREKLRCCCTGFCAYSPLYLMEADVMFALLNKAERSVEAERFVHEAERISQKVISCNCQPSLSRMDRIAMGKWSGRLLLLLMLFSVFWLTIQGANLPSRMLEQMFLRFGQWLGSALQALPWWLRGVLLEGVYGTVTAVVSVMLPPLLIFFPLFSLLEDFGYLTRAAYLTDRRFQKCGTCGKQALTMAMGLGCNAVGVTGCRIIDTPRERLVAIMTNSFMPCNGRFPAILTLAALAFGGNSLQGSVLVTGLLLLSVLMTFLASAALSRTMLKGRPSELVMELPPFRKPRIVQVLLRSFVDRTLIVLGRAVAVAAPAGIVIWCLNHIQAGDLSLSQWMIRALEPAGSFLGMNGVLLSAFVLSFPASELFLPLVSGLGGLELLRSSQTAVLCCLLFTIYHWPCGTTCLTIRKETGAWKWMLLSMLLPTVIGCAYCLLLKLVI